MQTKIEKEGITVITQIYEGIHGIYVAEYKGNTLTAQYGLAVKSDRDLQEAVKEFRQAYDNACEVIYNRQRYTSLFYDTYLPLAEGNGEIAMNFLKKAYTVSEEDEQYILNNSIKTE